MTMAIVLMLIAFGLVLLETIIPSFGLLGLLAATCYAFALIEAFAVEAATGWTFVALGVILLPLALLLGFRVLPMTPLGRALVLQPPKASGHQSSIACGMQGQAVTDLRPAGTALIGGQRVDVVSVGAFISNGCAVRVLQVEAMRVLVVPETKES